jgi:molybdopterin/thiamine biosynthesis adenylyltransferase
MVIKIIGCGGIGGIVTRGVHKLANASKNKIILIDNDTFEFGNISRQTFSTFGNKAEVLAEELSSLPHNVASIVANSDRYTFGCSSPTRIGDKQIIFCCVDNHFTRAIVNAHCKELANVTLISGGNEIQDGNVQFVVKKRGKIVAGDY